MENLSLHIEYLLLRHDCVIVPGIGAFINIYHPPYFDKDTGCIFPPQKEIRFNPALRSDDGMLANSFARKLEIPYREGSEILSRTISSLSNTLLREREVTIGRLGMIKMEPEGNIRFYPMKSVDKYCNDLGLIAAPFVKTSPQAELLKSRRIRNEKSGALVNSLDSTNSSSVEKNSENYNLPEKIKKMNFERNYYIPVNKLFSKACAVVLIIIICGLAWYHYPTNLKKGEERASVLPIDKVLDTAMQKSRNEKRIQKEQALSIEESKNPRISEGGSAEKAINNITNRFYLIVATCKTLEEANRYIDKHSSAMFDLEIVESTKLYRVSVKKSSEKDELREIMISPDFKQTFPKSWIWENERRNL